MNTTLRIGDEMWLICSSLGVPGPPYPAVLQASQQGQRQVRDPLSRQLNNHQSSFVLPG